MYQRTASTRSRRTPRPRSYKTSRLFWAYASRCSAIPANGFLVVFRHASAALVHPARRRLRPGTAWSVARRYQRTAALWPSGTPRPRSCIRPSTACDQELPWSAARRCHRTASTWSRGTPYPFPTFRRGCSARGRFPARKRDGTIEPLPCGSAAHRRDRRGTRRRGRVGPAGLPARRYRRTSTSSFPRLPTCLGTWHQIACPRGPPCSAACRYSATAAS